MAAESLFLGEFEHALDAQGRVAIPKSWRRDDGGRFFLVPGRNGILQLIPYDSFKVFLDKVRKIPFANANAAMALARFGSRAIEVECDKQGRVALPQRLQEYAGLKGQAVLVGAVSTIQLWEPERWRAESGSDESYLDEVERIGDVPDDFASLLKDTLRGDGN